MLPNKFRIKDVNSIIKIQDKYKTNFELKSIAQELIQNSLNESQQGDLRIYKNLILLEIDDDKNNIEETIDKINNGLSEAKQCYLNKEKRFQSLEKQQKHAKSHGRGFLTIFYFGWDIITLKNKKKLLIAAIKA